MANRKTGGSQFKIILGLGSSFLVMKKVKSETDTGGGKQGLKWSEKIVVF
jgi:hypothetical protein